MTNPYQRIDGSAPCALCPAPRRLHWGRANGLAPHRLGHQWRPAPKVEPVQVCAHCGAPLGECEQACQQRRETWGD